MVILNLERGTLSCRGNHLHLHYGAKYLFCFSPLVPSKQEKNMLVLLSLFFEGSVFTFQFLNDKIHNYVNKTY